MRAAGGDRLSRPERLHRKTEAGGKVVGGTAGNIADGRGVTAQLETGDHLIQGAVSAAGDDEICIAGLSAGKIHGIAALFRHVNGTEITGPVKHGDHVRKETPALPGAGVGIDDQVELFHRVPPKGIAMAAAAEEISPLRLRLRSK